MLLAGIGRCGAQQGEGIAERRDRIAQRRAIAGGAMRLLDALQQGFPHRGGGDRAAALVELVEHRRIHRPLHVGVAQAERHVARHHGLLRHGLPGIARGFRIGDVLRRLRQVALDRGKAAAGDAEGEVEAHAELSLGLRLSAAC